MTNDAYIAEASQAPTPRRSFGPLVAACKRAQDERIDIRIVASAYTVHFNTNAPFPPVRCIIKPTMTTSGHPDLAHDPNPGVTSSWSTFCVDEADASLTRVVSRSNNPRVQDPQDSPKRLLSRPFPYSYPSPRRQSQLLLNLLAYTSSAVLPVYDRHITHGDDTREGECNPAP
jgi:hypothetical protein